MISKDLMEMTLELLGEFAYVHLMSRGLNLFWTGPNLFGNESKSKFQYISEVSFGSSKILWTRHTYFDPGPKLFWTYRRTIEAS